MRDLARLVAATLLVGGCFGKTAPKEDGPWLGYQPDGVTDSGPTYSPLKIAKPTEVQCNQGALIGGSDDSCLAKPIDCVGAAEYKCFDFSDTPGLQGGSTAGRATKTLEHDGLYDTHYGIGHFRAPTPSDQVTSVGVPDRSDAFDFKMRVKVSSATGSVTLVRARVPIVDLDQGYSERSAVLELTGARLRACVPGPHCVDVGTFGREAWHTIVFQWSRGTLTAQLDCNAPVQLGFDVGTPDPTMSATIDYGIMWPTCESDVFVDLARED